MLRFEYRESQRVNRSQGVNLQSVLLEAERALLPRSISGVLNDYSDRALFAYDEDKLVGAFAYSISNTRRPLAQVLFAQGTIVANAYRGQGLGTQMWCKAIRRHRVRRVDVYIVNVRAIRMLRQIEARLPYVKINASFGETLHNKWCPRTERELLSSRYAKAWQRDHKEVSP